jgi:hypothetical protein
MLEIMAPVALSRVIIQEAEKILVVRDTSFDQKENLVQALRDTSRGFGQRGERTPHDTQYKFSCGEKVQVVV